MQWGQRGLWQGIQQQQEARVCPGQCHSGLASSGRVGRADHDEGAEVGVARLESQGIETPLGLGTQVGWQSYLNEQATQSWPAASLSCVRLAANRRAARRSERRALQGGF